MSRRPQDESTFGSDSFLDIVANIVGILIILIVVAGVRVSQAPLPSLEISQTADKDIEEPAPPALPVPIISLLDEMPIEAEFAADEVSLPHEVVVEPVLAAPDFVPPPEQQFPRLPKAKTPRHLLARTAELKRDLESQESVVAALQKEVSELEKQKAFTGQSHQQDLKLLTEAAEILSQREEDAETLEAENERSQQLVELIQQKLRDVDRSEPEPQQLAHRLNPVGRIVSGREVHFRLLGDKVAYVPVEELSLLVKRDMQRRRDFLLKQRRFQATVGPINGFEMEYLVQRSSGSILDEVRYGTSVVRVAVTDWVLRANEHAVEESLEEALQVHSQFRGALISGGSNATITFWVYPDSFDLHRELKAYVQETGFWVASRPLPMNFPIAGSASSGSKSVAQ